MHELASTVASLVLSPLNWLVLFLVLAIIIKKKKLKRVSIILAIVTFILFGSPWLLNWYARAWQPAPITAGSLPEYSCGIVPGGFGSPDANGEGYFNATADRFIQAVKLYKLGKVKHLLISGGNGKTDDKNFREAAWAKNELNTFGIPDSVIFVEDRSNNTKENAANSKAILDSLHFQPPFLLITSAFHIPRAALVFRKAGVPVDIFPCSYLDGRGPVSFADFIPNPKTISGWNLYLKETVGYLWIAIRS